MFLYTLITTNFSKFSSLNLFLLWVRMSLNIEKDLSTSQLDKGGWSNYEINF
jgi:hypothetical protein